ncbi:hypothetical protein JOE42_001227 [Rhodococcus corynebacterioides]|uniref:Uncharacterized protein n=1 Tax=Rhodococcoides corynebacterioides TaxID=53972 RepID=A0ABS2KRA2_9NOCA|nr:hypothetical protein [Rhodococcus corynebacterioides]
MVRLESSSANLFGMRGENDDDIRDARRGREYALAAVSGTSFIDPNAMDRGAVRQRATR